MPATMQRTNIILTGFMGCGKTTVGKLLARQLGYSFVDTDQLIEARSGMSVREIFALQGEPTFRRLETAVAGELGTGEGMVIATGGGLMLNTENARLLSATGRVFCLTARPEVILRRVAKSAPGVRPLLDAPDPLARIVELVRARKASYARFTQVDTSGKNPKQVMREILSRLESR
jgi:shikimate kinase